MNIADQKKEIREKLLKRRKSLSKETYEQYSVQIIEKLKKQPEFAEAETVHCYVSMNQNREVNTLALLDTMLLQMKEVAVPVMNRAESTLQHIQLVNFDQLESNTWGVLEPTSGKEMSPDRLELIIVPMVGGDQQKNRMGYGKGFYDRFLADVNCPTIGLLFESCLVDELPVDTYDVPLNKLITEKQIIE